MRVRYREEPLDACKGCARCGRVRCRTIKEPGYFWGRYGRCFARMNKARAEAIEAEIRKRDGKDYYAPVEE